VLLGGGLGLLSKAGAGIPPAVIAAVPVVLAVVVIWQERRRRTARRLELQARRPAEAGGS
jgi:sensor domain CHASE-containing protein